MYLLYWSYAFLIYLSVIIFFPVHWLCWVRAKRNLGKNVRKIFWDYCNGAYVGSSSPIPPGAAWGIYYSDKNEDFKKVLAVEIEVNKEDMGEIKQKISSWSRETIPFSSEQIMVGYERNQEVKIVGSFAEFLKYRPFVVMNTFFLIIERAVRSKLNKSEAD